MRYVLLFLHKISTLVIKIQTRAFIVIFDHSSIILLTGVVSHRLETNVPTFKTTRSKGIPHMTISN